MVVHIGERVRLFPDHCFHRRHHSLGGGLRVFCCFSHIYTRERYWTFSLVGDVPTRSTCSSASCMMGCLIQPQYNGRRPSTTPQVQLISRWTWSNRVLCWSHRVTSKGAIVQIESSSGVSFKFCRPSGAPGREPSVAMTRALQALSEADEMRQFVAEAHSQRKDIVVEVFQSRNGRPLLIHPNAAPKI
jgi:hypothetical protein